MSIAAQDAWLSGLLDQMAEQKVGTDETTVIQKDEDTAPCAREGFIPRRGGTA
jgi:hypothetical protein